MHLFYSFSCLSCSALHFNLLLLIFVIFFAVGPFCLDLLCLANVAGAAPLLEYGKPPPSFLRERGFHSKPFRTNPVEGSQIFGQGWLELQRLMSSSSALNAPVCLSERHSDLAMVTCGHLVGRSSW